MSSFLCSSLLFCVDVWVDAHKILVCVCVCDVRKRTQSQSIFRFFFFVPLGREQEEEDAYPLALLAVPVCTMRSFCISFFRFSPFFVPMIAERHKVTSASEDSVQQTSVESWRNLFIDVIMTTQINTHDPLKGSSSLLDGHFHLEETQRVRTRQQQSSFLGSGRVERVCVWCVCVVVVVRVERFCSLNESFFFACSFFGFSALDFAFSSFKACCF